MDEKFGRLTLIEVDRKDASYNKYWKCRCDCGSVAVVREDRLKTGKTKSCGCLAAETKKMLQVLASCEDRKYTRASYQAMLYRCHNTNSAAYATYGGRGIFVCDRWRYGDGANNGWTCFFMDMGPRPRGTTIDRIDGSLGYSPENCKWSTPMEQTINRTLTKLSFDDADEIRSSSKSHKETAKEFGVTRDHVKKVRQGKHWKNTEHPPS